MNTITICNANFYNNGYDDVIRKDLFLRFCIDSQKRLANNKNIFYKFLDYNNEYVIKAKEYFTEDWSTSEYKSAWENDQRSKTTVYVDNIKTYILSKVPNVVFLDNDVLVYNKNKFLTSILNKALFKGKVLDQTISSNLYNSEIYNKLFAFRIKNNVTNLNFDDGNLEQKARLDLGLKVDNLKKMEGVIHIAKFDGKIIIVNNQRDISKIKTNKSLIILTNPKLENVLNIKIKRYLKYYDTDSYIKKTLNEFLKIKV